MRLYCIVFGTVAIILGGGGPKPEGVRAWQDNPNLKANAELMIRISQRITKAIHNKEIQVTDKGLSGDLRIIDDNNDDE